jgi:hypothetical protein
MLTPHTPARLALVALAAPALTALLMAWACADDVPDDSPLRSRHELLNLGLAMTRARIDLKQALASDLAAGRLPLREAARKLRGYLEKEPRVEGLLSGRDCVARLPGASLEERCARSLLACVRESLSGSPEGAKRASRRLERELAEGYRR